MEESADAADAARRICRSAVLTYTPLSIGTLGLLRDAYTFAPWSPGMSDPHCSPQGPSIHTVLDAAGKVLEGQSSNPTLVLTHCLPLKLIWAPSPLSICAL